ncbi:MAG: hypothetical protein AAFN94_08335 [Pseudomonadota bacterium]
MTATATPTADDEWQGLLDPDERIIWQGKPSGRVQLEFESVFSVIFMAAWTALPLFALIAQPKADMLIIPVLFVGIGAYFFVGQHFWAAFQRRRTFYTLTNTRAFIGHAALTGRTLDSYPITPDTPLQLDEGRARAVWFATGPKARNFSNEGTAPIGFERLEDPRAVYQLLRNVQRGDA